MDLLSTKCCFRLNSCNLNLLPASHFLGTDVTLHTSNSPNFSTKSSSRYGGYIRASASQKQTKKSRKRQKMQKKELDLLQREQILDENEGVEEDKMFYSDTDEVQPSVVVPSSRSAVLQACTVTSGFMVALGVLIRQVSHVVSREGWPVLDCSEDITCKIDCHSFGWIMSNIKMDEEGGVSFESWHLGLIMGSVIVVSSCRFLLLKLWPDFAESSQAANQQVLTFLEPLDYLVVAFLPGISEELLFRGALLPLFGVNWLSIFAVAALFGVLHLGSGRKYSFAVWGCVWLCDKSVFKYSCAYGFPCSEQLSRRRRLAPLFRLIGSRLAAQISAVLQNISVLCYSSLAVFIISKLTNLCSYMILCHDNPSML